jgi:hypothetical protein
MKPVILLTSAALFCSCSLLFAQTQRGSWELSLSGTMGSESISITAKTVNSTFDITGKGDQKYLRLSLRPGYYVLKGLTLEPEILWNAVERYAPTFSLSGNLSYNFSIPQAHFAPFVLIGYGLTNGLPVFRGYTMRAADGFDVNVVNLGSGLKFFFSERAAFRTEYRYQRLRYDDASMFSGIYDVKINMHSIFFGFSVFLH